VVGVGEPLGLLPALHELLVQVRLLGRARRPAALGGHALADGRVAPAIERVRLVVVPEWKSSVTFFRQGAVSMETPRCGGLSGASTRSHVAGRDASRHESVGARGADPRLEVVGWAPPAVETTPSRGSPDRQFGSREQIPVGQISH